MDFKSKKGNKLRNKKINKNLCLKENKNSNKTSFKNNKSTPIWVINTNYFIFYILKQIF